MPTTILFIIGRPGSGKTTAADFVASLANSKLFSVAQLNDYSILHQMSRADTNHSRFLPTRNDGFDVIDFSVMDEVLHIIEHEAKSLYPPRDFITIEFARDDYDKAMSLFHDDFLTGAYFLYLEVKLEMCLARIHERVAHPSTPGDHPSLSDDKFKEYYGKDDKLYITTNFKTDYNLFDRQVVVIQNDGTKEEFLQGIEQYFKEIILKAIKSD